MTSAAANLLRTLSRTRQRSVHCDRSRAAWGNAEDQSAAFASHLHASTQLRRRHALRSTLDRAPHHFRSHGLKRSAALHTLPQFEASKVGVQVAAGDRAEPAGARRDTGKDLPTRFARRRPICSMFSAMTARTESLNVRRIEKPNDVASGVRIFTMVRLQSRASLRLNFLSTSHGQRSGRAPYIAIISLCSAPLAPIPSQSNQLARVAAPAMQHVPADSALYLFVFHAVTDWPNMGTFSTEIA